MANLLLALALTLLLGLAFLDLLLPSLSWRVHTWSQRRAGITGIERTRHWEWLRIARGGLMLLLACAVLFLHAQFREEPAETKMLDPPQARPIHPSDLPVDVREGIPEWQLERLRESLERAPASGR